MKGRCITKGGRHSKDIWDASNTDFAKDLSGGTTCKIQGGAQLFRKALAVLKSKDFGLANGKGRGQTHHDLLVKEEARCHYRMQNTVYRYAKAGFWTRLFSSSSQRTHELIPRPLGWHTLNVEKRWHSHTQNYCPSRTRAFSSTSRPIASTRFIDSLLKETHEPIWRLLKALHTPYRSVDLPAALFRHGVSIDEYNMWKPILLESNIFSAVETLKSQACIVHPSQISPEGTTTDHPLPSWVVLYLVTYKVRTHQNAAVSCLDLTYSHLPTAPVPVQGPLLILTLLGLARFNLLVPMRRVVDTFLTTNLNHPALYFNLLLQALAHTPTRSIDAANAVVAILRSMDARQLKLTGTTYEMLLNDRFVTLQLTKHLRDRMIHEGHVPTAEQLEAYLRVFAKHGAIHDANKYREALQAHASTDLVAGGSGDGASDVMHRANTLFLGAHEDRASAFGFLRSLASPGAQISSPSSSASTPAKPAPDIYTSTTALSVAARDPSVPTSMLLSIFSRLTTSTNKAPPPPSRAPTVATHSVLIRGLLRRKEPGTALKAWRTLYESGIPLDREALALGLQVLTGAGEPHRAVALLEEWGALPGEEAVRGRRGKRRLQLSPVGMNDFLVALNRIARPDVVFRLWDNMGPLYGVYPDARSLSILLQAARLARRLDDSFEGAVAQLARHNPFRRSSASEMTTTREERLQALTSIVGTPDSGLLPYRSASWGTDTPVTRALKIFQQALFGNFAEAPNTLLHAPFSGVHALRAAPLTDPMSTSPFGLLPSLDAHIRPAFMSPPDLLTKDGRSRYPTVVVRNEGFFNYVMLLGLGGRAVDVPVALAWMRAAGVKPGRGTLAIAMVFWGEVSVGVPLMERGGHGGEGRGQYGKLWEWTSKWVGEKRMPDERLLEWWAGRVEKLRRREL
ncbi:hypothetical protein Hypma_009312 [Hypsizygus marmoreus]|uniref:Uncharacterized protein n=1 Tax=Hypsizygus marmoreus TaxID=39966 RepID=A0A369JRC6_HYPMA|nr:hypothetical protein Hypma_009312 [Hypsizygus marmoreus]